MRRLLLLSAAVVMFLIPAIGGAYAAFFPRQSRIFPVTFWVLWLLVSLCATFYAPVAVDRLTPEIHASHRCAAYARWGIALGLINLAWSVAEIVVLG